MRPHFPANDLGSVHGLGAPAAGSWRSGQPRTRRTLGKVWDNAATWWLLGSITAGNNPPPTRAGLWVRSEPYRGAGGGRWHSGAFNPNGQYRKRAAWGREHEGISASGQGWALRSTRGCRLPSWRDVGEPGMKGWKWEPLGKRVSGVTVRRCLEESVRVGRQRGRAWRLGPGRQDTSPGSGPRVWEVRGGTRGQQLA